MALTHVMGQGLHGRGGQGRDSGSRSRAGEASFDVLDQTIQMGKYVFARNNIAPNLEIMPA